MFAHPGCPPRSWSGRAPGRQCTGEPRGNERYVTKGWIVPAVVLQLMLLSSCAPSIATDTIEASSTAIANQNLLPSPVPSGTSTPTAEASITPTISPTPSATPTVTSTPTPMPPAEGFALVPDVVGMPYLAARGVVARSGLSYLRHDVLDLDHPVGTVLGQEPSPGAVIPLGRIVMLYTAFEAHAMWVGEACYPLKITSPKGRLLFFAHLKESERYEIATDFEEGNLTVYDYRMVEILSIESALGDSLVFQPAVTGDYVLALGPYQVGQADLDAHPGGIPAGCLWVRELD